PLLAQPVAPIALLNSPLAQLDSPLPPPTVAPTATPGPLPTETPSPTPTPTAWGANLSDEPIALSNGEISSLTARQAAAIASEVLAEREGVDVARVYVESYQIDTVQWAERDFISVRLLVEGST